MTTLDTDTKRKAVVGGIVTLRDIGGLSGNPLVPMLLAEWADTWLNFMLASGTLDAEDEAYISEELGKLMQKRELAEEDILAYPLDIEL